MESCHLVNVSATYVYLAIFAGKENGKLFGAVEAVEAAVAPLGLMHVVEFIIILANRCDCYPTDQTRFGITLKLSTLAISAGINPAHDGYQSR